MTMLMGEQREEKGCTVSSIAAASIAVASIAVASIAVASIAALVKEKKLKKGKAYFNIDRIFYLII